MLTKSGLKDIYMWKDSSPSERPIEIIQSKEYNARSKGTTQSFLRCILDFKYNHQEGIDRFRPSFYPLTYLVDLMMYVVLFGYKNRILMPT